MTFVQRIRWISNLQSESIEDSRDTILNEWDTQQNTKSNIQRYWCRIIERLQINHEQNHRISESSICIKKDMRRNYATWTQF